MNGLGVLGSALGYWAFWVLRARRKGFSWRWALVQIAREDRSVLSFIGGFGLGLESGWRFLSDRYGVDFGAMSPWAVGLFSGLMGPVVVGWVAFVIVPERGSARAWRWLGVS